MFMGNKVILLLMLVVFFSCDKHTDCKIEEIDSVYFKGFNEINKISIEDLIDKTNNLEFVKPELDSIDFKTKSLVINYSTTELFKNGFKIRINDSISYKITDVKMEEIYKQKNTMWGKIYGCTIKEYRVNDLLISSYGVIMIEK